MTAYILARRGSKRIPEKHVRPLCAAPLIQHAIWRARECREIDRIVVSTNDPAVVRTVNQFQVWCQLHERSEGNASAEAPMWRALLEAVEDSGEEPVVAMVYASAAFLRPAWMAQAVAMVGSGDYDSACVVYQSQAPVERSLVLNADGAISSRFPEYDNANNLGWPPTYHHASQLFVARAEAVRMAQTLMIPGRTGGVVVPRHHVEDIDSPEDWAVAEQKLRMLHGSTADCPS